MFIHKKPVVDNPIVLQLIAHAQVTSSKCVAEKVKVGGQADVHGADETELH
jgi:hypothetical protein